MERVSSLVGGMGIYCAVEVKIGVVGRVRE